MATDTIITTKRLRLRTWCTRDAQAFDTHCNTPQVMTHLGGTVAARSVRREVRWYIADQARYGHTFWVLERKRDSAFIGFCGVIRVPEISSPLHGKLEIGWRVRADQWRRGYAYEAALAVIDWAQWELRDDYVYARIHQDNAASQALARKLGMRRARALEARQRKLDAELLVFRLALG